MEIEMKGTENDFQLDDEKHPLTDEKVKRTYNAPLVALLVLLSVFLIVALVVIIYLGFVSSSCSSSSNTSNTCMSTGCVNLASAVLGSMNTSVDPCTDFYNFSCGGWDNANVIPSGYGLWSVFQQLDKRNKIAIKKLLDGDQESNVEAIQWVRQLYKSCLDVNTLTAQGAEPLLKLLNETGGWDLIGLRNSSAPVWSTSTYGFRWSQMLGNGGFFNFYMTVNDKNSSQYIPVLTQSGLTLPSKLSYTDERQINKTIPALQMYISSILKLLGPTENADYTLIADQIIELEKDLANISVSSVDLRDPVATYNSITLGELSNGTYWSQFNWTEFVKETFKMAGVNDISDDLIIIVRTPSYFIELTDVFAKYNTTVLENYYNWQLVKNYVSSLGQAFLSVYYKYTSVVYGTGEIERYLTCIKSMSSIVPMSISRLYTNYVLQPGTRGNISEVVAQIKLAFQQRLKTNSFLDETTKQKSIWKVGNISEMIAYPDDIMNNTYLLDKSKAVINGNGDYFETQRWDILLSNLKNLQRIGKPVNKKEWQLAPTAVNAYYEPLYNEFVFLEGILNFPFFQSDWPEYFKYGSFGVVAGHELTHGFDDQGQQYDQYGVLRQWWSDKSVVAFKEKKECFVDQYSKYSIFGFNINGELTQGENIADNGGLKTAYQAYKNVISSSSRTVQQSLPSVDLTPDQLFFVAYAQVWCSIFSRNFIATNLKVNPHSPGPYRVIGALSNSEEFADAFQCKSGSFMNPSKKCDLW